MLTPSPCHHKYSIDYEVVDRVRNMHVIMTLDATSIGGATPSNHVFAAGQTMEYQDDEDGESSMRWRLCASTKMLQSMLSLLLSRVTPPQRSTQGGSPPFSHTSLSLLSSYRMHSSGKV